MSQRNAQQPPRDPVKPDYQPGDQVVLFPTPRRGQLQTRRKAP